MRRCRHDEIRRVVERVRALLTRPRATERQVLGDADGPSDLAFDAEDPVDHVRDTGPKRVVAEFRGGISAGVKRGSAGDERDFDRARSCHLPFAWTRRVCVSVSAASPFDISKVFEEVINEIAQKHSAIATLLASRERRVAIRY